MDKTCIDNFFAQCRSSHFERHSDSSDFENPYNVLVKDNNRNTLDIAPKDISRYHSLIKNKTCKIQKTDVVSRQFCDNFNLYSVNTPYDRDDMPEKEIKIYPRSQFLCNKHVDCTSFNEKESITMSRYIHERDQNFNFKDNSSSRLSLRSKVVPSLSKILRRPDSCKPRNIPDNYNSFNTAYCVYCDHSRMNNFRKPHSDYSIQPIHAVAKEIAGYPFQRINHCVELSQVDAMERCSSDYMNEYSLSSCSEQEDIIKPYKRKKLMRYIMHKLDKRIRREYGSVGTIKHEKQQYPSKSQLNSPYQVFTTSSCQTKNASTNSESHGAMPSNSSDFWELLFQKIKYHVHKAEVSKCNAKPCDKDSCQFSKINSSSSQTPSKPKTQTKDSPRQSSSQVLPKKKSKDSGVFCKCPKPNKSRNPAKIKSQNAMRPCQEEHDALKKALASKYNGEILCIHNPPCVLINGCLNLPFPKSPTQGAFFYPVTQSKRSSFAQMCRKIKRSKQKSQDQAVQLQPPTIDLHEYLPEFKTEKIVQSLCNHNPPCEVVRGCHKARFNPTLQTSCVHVPMCPKFPECILEQRNIEERTCNHTPKCAELPLCTRKYITLTAKENAATQVKPKTKIGCRHKPPCLMIPKCLAQAICGDCYPGNTIPGCAHQPSCEMISACFRKQMKESVSLQSQHPSACQIV